MSDESIFQLVEEKVAVSLCIRFAEFIKQSVMCLHLKPECNLWFYPLLSSKLLFLLDFFNILNAKTAAITSSSSKFSKSKSIFFLCVLVSFDGKVCHGFWHQTTGARFQRQKPAPDTGARNWPVCHQLKEFLFSLQRLCNILVGQFFLLFCPVLFSFFVRIFRRFARIFTAFCPNLVCNSSPCQSLRFLRPYH